MFGELIPCGGGESIPLHESSVTVGRSSSNDVCIPLKFISGSHCRMELRNDVWHVIDNNSRNGVKINGEKVSEGAVEDNDIVSFGSARYTLVYARSNDSSHIIAMHDPESGDIDGDSFWSEMMMVSAPRVESLSTVLAAKELGTLTPCGGGDPIVMFKKKLIAGRRSRCDLVLDFKSISGKHCELELRKGFWHVEDLGSRNGIKIDGERTDAGYLLPGSILSVARQRYEIQYTAPEGVELPVSNPFAKGLLEKAGLGGAQQERIEEDDDDDDEEEVRPRHEIN